MTYEQVSELETVERLLKERNEKKYYISLLQEGKSEEVIELLSRDLNTIDEAIQLK